MLLTVSVTVEVSASQGINAVEQQVLATGQQVMGQLMRAAVRAYEETRMSCPRCGSLDLLSRGTRGRMLLTRFGRVEVPLRRQECRQCGQRFRPAAGCLAELHGNNVTAGLARACVLAGSSWAYREAAAVLQDLSGAQVSPETVRALTAQAGQQEAQRQLQQAQAQVTTTAAQVRTERASALVAPAAPAGPVADEVPHLLTGLDGGWVPSREQRGGMEGKVGVVAGGWEAVGQQGRHRLHPRRYVATFASSEQLGELAYAAATALGAAQAPVQVALGDGAGWIKTQVDWHFPDAVRILDWPHLARALHQAIRAACPGPAQRARRRELHQQLPAALWQGDVDGALAQLAALRPAGADEPIPRLEETITYLQAQRAWIGNYQAWQEAGYPIGSGLVERAVELVINRRLKRRGMRWLRANADAVVALRVQRLNGDWDRRCADLPLVA